MRILLVDDEPAIVEFAEKLLVCEGYDVTARVLDSDAVLKEILGYTFEDKFEIALIGIVMPFMDGFELARWIRSLSKGIRIVALDTHTDFGQEIVRQGIADAFVQTPFEVETLREALQQAARR